MTSASPIPSCSGSIRRMIICSAVLGLTATVTMTAAFAQVPYDYDKFQQILDTSKLQYPDSGTEVDYGEFDGVETECFYLTNDSMTFEVEDDGERCELRNEYQWDSSDDNNTMEARVKILEGELGTSDFTFMQIHEYEGGNQPLIRLYWAAEKDGQDDGIWAALREEPGVEDEHIYVADRFTSTFMPITISVQDNQLTVEFNGSTEVSSNISDWEGRPLYFKAGAYNGGDGTAKSYFSKLETNQDDDDVIDPIDPDESGNIDFEGMTASHTDPDGEETKPVSSSLCNNDWVDCHSNGTVTFTTVNTSDGVTTPTSSYLRSEMRMYADYCGNDGDDLSAGNVACEFVLDGSGSAGDAGGVNATVTSRLRIDHLPSTSEQEDEGVVLARRHAVIFSQFHGSGAEPMRAYAVSTSPGSNTFDVMIWRDDADNVAQEQTYFGLSLEIGEPFDFDVSIDGDGMLVSVDGTSRSITVDDGFNDDDEYIYAKWGAYAATNEADVGDDSEVTYYEYNIDYD